MDRRRLGAAWLRSSRTLLSWLSCSSSCPALTWWTSTRTGPQQAFWISSGVSLSSSEALSQLFSKCISAGRKMIRLTCFSFLLHWDFTACSVVWETSGKSNLKSSWPGMENWNILWNFSAPGKPFCIRWFSSSHPWSASGSIWGQSAVTTRYSPMTTLSANISNVSRRPQPSCVSSSTS